jgi:hypothetical protein
MNGRGAKSRAPKGPRGKSMDKTIKTTGLANRDNRACCSVTVMKAGTDQHGANKRTIAATNGIRIQVPSYTFKKPKEIEKTLSPAKAIKPTALKDRMTDDDDKTPEGNCRKSDPDAESRRCTDPDNLDDLETLFPQVEIVEASKASIGEHNLEHATALSQDWSKNSM